MTPFHPNPIPAYERNRELQDEAAAEQNAREPCAECDGDGWAWVQEAVTHQLGTDMQTVRGDCPACNGTGDAA